MVAQVSTTISVVEVPDDFLFVTMFNIIHRTASEPVIRHDFVYSIVLLID